MTLGKVATNVVHADS